MKVHAGFSGWVEEKFQQKINYAPRSKKERIKVVFPWSIIWMNREHSELNKSLMNLWRSDLFAQNERKITKSILKQGIRQEATPSICDWQVLVSFRGWRQMPCTWNNVDKVLNLASDRGVAYFETGRQRSDTSHDGIIAAFYHYSTSRAWMSKIKWVNRGPLVTWTTSTLTT